MKNLTISSVAKKTLSASLFVSLLFSANALFAASVSGSGCVINSTLKNQAITQQSTYTISGEFADIGERTLPEGYILSEQIPLDIKLPVDARCPVNMALTVNPMIEHASGALSDIRVSFKSTGDHETQLTNPNEESIIVIEAVTNQAVDRDLNPLDFNLTLTVDSKISVTSNH